MNSKLLSNDRLVVSTIVRHDEICLKCEARGIVEVDVITTNSLDVVKKRVYDFCGLSVIDKIDDMYTIPLGCLYSTEHLVLSDENG